MAAREERINKLLTDLDIPDNLLESEEDTTTEIINHIANKFEPMLTKKIVENENPKMNAKFDGLNKRNLCEQYGLTTEEIKGLDIKGIVELGRNKDLTKINGKESEHMQIIINLRNDLERYKTEVIPNMENNFEGRLKTFTRNEMLKKELLNYKIAGDIDYHMPAIISKLESKYKIFIDESNCLSITDKQGNGILRKNQLDFKTQKEILLEELTAVGILLTEVKAADVIKPFQKTVENAKEMKNMSPAWTKAYEDLKRKEESLKNRS